MGLNPRSTILPQQCPLSKTENCLKANNLKKETFFFRKNTINGMKLQNDNKKELLFLNTELLQPEVKNWLYITCHPLQDSQSWHEKALLLFFSPLISTALASPMRAVSVTEQRPLTDKLMCMYQTNGQLGLDWKLPEDPKWAGAADRPPRSAAFRRRLGINGPAGTSSSSTTGNAKSCSWERIILCTSTVLKTDYEKLDTIPFKFYNLCMVPYWS